MEVGRISVEAGLQALVRYSLCRLREDVHKFAYPAVVLERLRRQEVEVTQGNWHVVIAQANEELLRMGESPIDLASAWSFAEKGRLFWIYVLSKLNTELHGKSISIEGRNGFELYRQVVRAVDDIPENANFLMGAELSDMVKRYGDKVKDLKSMYGFRLLLKKRIEEYKNIIGEEVDSGKLHEILWNVMGPDTKLTASRQGVHTKSNKALTGHIDEIQNDIRTRRSTRQEGRSDGIFLSSRYRRQ